MRIRNFLIGCIMLLFGNTALAQDIIIKQDASEIKAHIEEVGDELIKYRRHSNPSGPIYSIRKTEVFMIRYENGEQESMNAADEAASATPSEINYTSRNVSYKAADVQKKNLYFGLDAEVGYLISTSEEVLYDGLAFGLKATLEWYCNKQSPYGMALSLGYKHSDLNFIYTEDESLSIDLLNLDLLFTQSTTQKSFFWNAGFRFSIPCASRMISADMNSITKTTFGLLVGCGWRFKGFQVGASLYMGFTRQFDLDRGNAPMLPSIQIGYRF